MSQQNGQTLIVTGGAGFIGSSFVALAVRKGYHVVVLDALTYAGHRENLEWIAPETGSGAYELAVGNICDTAFVTALIDRHQPRAILNFAAESHVDNSITGPREFIDTNIIGCFTLLEAARAYWYGLEGESRKNFRFLQVSTDEVFGSLGPVGKFSEDSPMRPNSPYSASKAAGDHLARAWFETYGLPTLVSNCTNNYGPRQHPEKLIPLMITRAISGLPMPVYGDGEYIRDWIHVEDHVAGVLLALEKGVPGESYGFGGDAERNNNQVVAAICRLLDKAQPRPNGQSYQALVTHVTDRPGHDRRYAIDDSKSCRELGFTRQYTFDSGLQATVEWYLENAAWREAVAAKKKGAA